MLSQIAKQFIISTINSYLNEQKYKEAQQLILQYLNLDIFLDEDLSKWEEILYPHLKEKDE